MHMVLLPPFRGHLVCFMISASYISSLYLIPRKVRDSPRDDPTHIRYRILAASFATFVSGIVCFFCFESWNFPSHISFLEACGFRIDTAAMSITRSCLLMAVFYLGPLTTSAIYLHTSHFYGVDDCGRIGRKEDDVRNISILMYPWEYCSRCVCHSFSCSLLRWSYFSFCDVSFSNFCPVLCNCQNLTRIGIFEPVTYNIDDDNNVDW